MRHRVATAATLAIVVAAFGAGIFAVHAAEAPSAGTRASVDSRLNRLEAEVSAAEDVQAIKRLQRIYGYYVDKGMWEDLGAFFTEDAVANYPAGTFIGHDSIRQHLFMNVGGKKMGEVGLGDNRSTITGTSSPSCVSMLAARRRRGVGEPSRRAAASTAARRGP